MRAIFLVALRNLTYRPGRAISCAMGIALGMAIVMSVLIVDHNTILTQVSMNPKSYGDPDMEIQPLRVELNAIEVQRERLINCEGIEDLAATYFSTCSVQAMNGSLHRPQICGLDDRAAAGFNAYRVKTGADLDFYAPPNLLLSRQAAEKLKVQCGDVVTVWIDTPRRNICRDGKLIPARGRDPATAPPLTMDFKVQGILAEEHLGLRNIVIVPFMQGLPLFEGTYLCPKYWAKKGPGYDLTAVQAELKERFTVEKPYRRALVGESLEEKAFRNGVRLCALLSLLLGLYIIFNSMSMSLVERIRQIGLLRAMGITRGGLTQIFLMEGFLLSLAGCCFSVLFTALIVYYMQSEGITTLGFGRPLEILDVPYLHLAGVMALGVVFSLLGVIYPVGKASKLSVIQAVRKGTIEFEKRPFQGFGRFLFVIYMVLIPLCYFAISPRLSGRYLDMFLLIIYLGIAVAVVIGLLLFFPILLNAATTAVIFPLSRIYKVTGRLALASMRTARLRIFSTVSGLTLVFAAIFVVASLTDSLLSETEAWSDKNLVRNIFVRSAKPGTLDPALFDQVEGVEAVLNLSASIQSSFSVLGLPVEELRKFGMLKDKPYPDAKLRNEDWIIVSSRLAKSYDYQVNDRVKLSTSEAGLKVFRVLAIYDGYGFFPDNRSYAVISDEKMLSYFCVTADRGDKWSLYLKDGASPRGVAAALEEKLGDQATLALGTDLKQEYLDDLSNNFSIFTIIISLVAVLSGLSILNSLVIAVVERRRESALLRVVGLTPAQLKGILFMEAFGLGLLGGFFGLLLGFPLSYLTVKGIQNLSYLELVPTFKADTILITFLGALAVSLAASVYPILRQGGTDLMEAVKYE